jgi:hypothetical protein
MANRGQKKVRISVKRLHALQNAEELHKERHRATYSMLMAAVHKFGIPLVVTQEDLTGLDDQELDVSSDEGGAITMRLVPKKKPAEAQ